MPACWVPFCKSTFYNKNNEKISFFRLPKNPLLREKWINKCGKVPVSDNKDPRICNKHFTDDDFEEDLRARLMNLPPRAILKTTAVPSQNLPAVIYPASEENEIKVFKRKYNMILQENKKLKKALAAEKKQVCELQDRIIELEEITKNNSEIIVILCNKEG